MGLDWSLISPLAPLEAEIELPDEEIGKEGGSRRTLHLQTRSGAQYLCKGPSLMPDHPFIAVNEWVVAGLAKALGIPIRASEILRWGGALFFGSEVLDKGRRMSGPIGTTWTRLKNAPAVAYLVVALDAWVLNTDRHDQNYLPAVLGNGVGMFLASDHDLGLFGSDRTAASLPGFVTRPVDAAVVRSPTLRDAISDWDALDAALDAVERVDDGYIQTIVGQLPREWIDAEGQQAAVDFLSRRRALLRGLFIQGAATFPNLPHVTP